MGAGGEEVRLAIVMNGGVSLAVWMGGVAHEIDLLRRASCVARGASREDVGRVAGYDRAIFEKWVEFCTAHPIGEVVVDVVAGTSAGGLNGTLLATAIARGVPLDAGGDGDGPWLRGLWLDQATLDSGKLLRTATADPAPSVLDGDFFTATVARAVRELTPAAGRRTAAGPVTLFVTSTSLGPSDRRYRDSFGQPFDVPDHRRLYRFARSEDGAVAYAPGAGGAPDGSWWRPTLVDAFAGTRPGAAAPDPLVAAARASASFPFAFVPVPESEELAARRVLPPRSVESASGHYLTDGGILDNAPFQPVLDAITRRPLDQPVRRMLVYVVPSAGTAAKPAQPAADLPAWDRIAASVVGFPGESDVRDDMALAEELVTSAEGQTAAPEACFRAAAGGDRALATAASGLLPQYRLARVVGGLLEVRGTLAAARPELGVTLAPQSVDRAEELLDAPVPWLPDATGDPAAAYGEDRWSWGLAAAERVVRLMARDLRTRFAEAGADASDRLAVISARLNQIEAVRDAVRDAVVAGADSAPQDADAALIGWVGARFTALRVREALGWCVRTAADEYAAALPTAGGAAGAVAAGLAVEVSTQAFSAYQPFSRTAPFQLLRLGPDVETPMVDRDAGRADAARAAGARKLYGTRLRHFAAFGRASWRRWDWAAGRLDAQTHLARALVATGGAGDAEQRRADEWVAQVQELTVAAELALDPAGWRERREQLGRTDDMALLTELREQDRSGPDLTEAVVDAAMRALPLKHALGGTGGVLNALFARKPQRPRKLWTRLARPFTRYLWRRKVASLGRRS